MAVTIARTGTGTPPRPELYVADQQHYLVKVFDLDGTLADTSADLLGAANAVLAPRGYPLLTLERDKRFAGRGGKSMIRRSLSLLESRPSEREVDAIADALYPGLLVAYEARLADETHLFEGTLEMLSVPF